MSERIGSHGWRVWKEKGLPQEVVPLSDAEGMVAKLEEENQALLRVARAAQGLPEYFALPEDELPEWAHKHRWCPYCDYKEPDGHWKDCEGLKLFEALKALPEGLLNDQ